MEVMTKVGKETEQIQERREGRRVQEAQRKNKLYEGEEKESRLQRKRQSSNDRFPN